jgi:hypothetical protein
MKIQFFMKNGPRIHEKSFSTQKAIKRSSFCSIFNENRMKIIFWLQILALREDMSTNSAEDMATSEPDPIAMPTSAMVNAGASLMPSPTIATARIAAYPLHEV